MGWDGQGTRRGPYEYGVMSGSGIGLVQCNESLLNLIEICSPPRGPPLTAIANSARPPGAPPHAPGVHLAIAPSPMALSGTAVQVAPWSSESAQKTSSGVQKRDLSCSNK